jgi:hypothetical protein
VTPSPTFLPLLLLGVVVFWHAIGIIVKNIVASIVRLHTQAEKTAVVTMGVSMRARNIFSSRIGKFFQGLPIFCLVLLFGSNFQFLLFASTLTLRTFILSIPPFPSHFLPRIL